MRSGHIFRALLAPLMVGTALAGWPLDPTENLMVVDRTGEQIVPKVACTADGGCYIGWYDHASGNFDVYLQHLDRFGREVWPHNGILVSDNLQDSWVVDWDLIVDSADNAVLVFADIRAGGELDIYAYRISPAGDFLWGPDGVTLSANDDFEPAPRVAETSDGDFVFVWARQPDAGKAAIVIQKLDPDGTPQFGPDGLEIGGAAEEVPGFPDVVPAEDGGFIVVWVHDIGYYSVKHVRTQKFSADGVPLWSVTPLELLDNDSLPIAYAPVLASDGAGGGVYAWHCGATMLSSFVQRVDAGGTELFTHNGVEVSTRASYHHISPAVAYAQATGEVLVFWSERTASQGQRGIYGQKVSSLGVREWGDSGRELLPVDDVYRSDPRCLTVAGGALVFYFDEPTGTYGEDRVLGVRVDTAGNVVWPGSPREVSALLSGKGRLPVARAPRDTAIAVWEDDRAGDGDIYAQNINANGSLGVLGDLNCDGVVNTFDIDPFVMALTDPTNYAATYPECDIMLADVDGSGAVDTFDIDAFVDLLTGR